MIVSNLYTIQNSIITCFISNCFNNIIKIIYTVNKEISSKNHRCGSIFQQSQYYKLVMVSLTYGLVFVLNSTLFPVVFFPIEGFFFPLESEFPVTKRLLTITFGQIICNLYLTG